MDWNTYTPAAFEALMELSKSAKKEDRKIAEAQWSGSKIYGQISMDFEDLANSSDPHVYTLNSLGMRIKTNGSSFIDEIPRSCHPNFTLSHRFGTNVLLNLYLSARRSIDAGVLITIPFNHDCIFSNMPLDCEFHPNGTCPLEKKRQKLSEMREIFLNMKKKELEEFSRYINEILAYKGEENEAKIVISENAIVFKTRKKMYPTSTFETACYLRSSQQSAFKDFTATDKNRPATSAVNPILEHPQHSKRTELEDLLAKFNVKEGEKPPLEITKWIADQIQDTLTSVAHVQSFEKVENQEKLHDIFSFNLLAAFGTACLITADSMDANAPKLDSSLPIATRSKEDFASEDGVVGLSKEQQEQLLTAIIASMHNESIQMQSGLTHTAPESSLQKVHTDRNTYSPAAREALLKLSETAEKRDEEIDRYRESAASEVWGEITLDSEVGDNSDPRVFTNDELGIRIKTNGALLINKCRRSCDPIIRLKICFGSNVLLALFAATSRKLEKGDHELTMPFNKGWIHSKVPLECATHPNGDCPFEKQRLEVSRKREAEQDEALLKELGEINVPSGNKAGKKKAGKKKSKASSKPGNRKP